MAQHKKIAVIGGGITGLSAAYYLHKAIEKDQLPYEVQLFEAGNRLGGKIETVHKDGFVIERGADSFLARKAPTLRLIEELNLNDYLVRNSTGQSFVLVNGKLHKIPKGSHRGVPVRLGPFWRSSLFSFKGKVRGSMDLLLKKGKMQKDQSLGHFFRNRFGNEFVDNLIEPLLAGIYSGNIDDMSLMATFPNFFDLEQEHGSLVKGLQSITPNKGKKQQIREGAFFSLKNGLGTLIDRLAEELSEKIQLNTAVDHIEKKEEGYHMLLSNGSVYKADTIVMATEHEAVPKIFSQYDFFKTFNDIPSTSTANVALAFDKSAIKRDVNGTGFVISRKSDTRITACTWTHKKWPETTPEGKVLMRCYVGKPNDQDIVNLSDEEITEIVLKDLKKIMNIKKAPEFSVITRWKKARPQYNVGHLDKIHFVQDEVKAQLPGVFLAGSSYEGVGIPDCIYQGEQAVQSVLDYLK